MPRPKRHPDPRAALVEQAGNPLVRAGLTITAGIVAGNLTGFVRVAVTAYLLGTGSQADALAVALGPLDTFNHVLISTMIFAFAPMLAARDGSRRTALFHQLHRAFGGAFLGLNVIVLIFAPWLVAVLAPGLAPDALESAIGLLRVGSFSITAIGSAALHSALLYTDRRFAPSAFHQATINAVTVVFATALWRLIGPAGFAIGYTAGAWVQLIIVWLASRDCRTDSGPARDTVRWIDLAAKPCAILVYSSLVALNLVATRAFATHLEPGTAAAFEYSLRCIGVPLAFLVSPISNSLLPEMARLRSLGRLPEAFHLVDRALRLAGAAALAASAIGIVLRGPAIRFLFERGNFTAASTQLVSAAFLGFAPALIGWSLIEITARSLFAIDKAWLPAAAAVIPVAFNVAFLSLAEPASPEYLGVGSSIGLLAGFFILFQLARVRRKKWVKT